MNEDHLNEFFHALEIELEEINRKLLNKEEVDLSKPIEIYPHINASLFSYQGWGITESSKEQEQQNSAVRRFLQKSLGKPTIIYDLGIGNGKRTLQDIILELPTRTQTNIQMVFGVDNNHNSLQTATQIAKKLNIPFTPIHDNIQTTDFLQLHNQISSNKNYLKKVSLGLGNTLFNNGQITTIYDQGVTKLIRKISSPGDEVYVEFRHSNSPTTYVEETETFVKNYFIQSGLEEKIGGELKPVFDEEGKKIILSNTKKQVTHNGKTYYLTANVDGKEQPLQFVIAASNKLPLPKLFEFLINNYANNLYLESRFDICWSEEDVLMKLKHFEAEEWLEDIKEKVDNQLKQFKEEWLCQGVGEYILMHKEYPPYYLNFMFEDSEFFGFKGKEQFYDFIKEAPLIKKYSYEEITNDTKSIHYMGNYKDV